MRIVRLKIKPTVREALSEVSSQFRTGDRGFVEDLYALVRLKGNGLPSKQRIQKLIEYVSKAGGIGKVTAQIIINKRAQVLKQAVGTAYFKALTKLRDPIDAVRRLLTNFQKLYLKYREAQCRSCQYFTNCDFGKQYGNATVDIRRVIDPDFKKKTHPQCPVLPQIGLTYQISESMAMLKNLVQNQLTEAKAAGMNAEDIAEAEEQAENELLELDADDDLAEESMEMEEDGISFADPTGKGKGTHGFGSRYTGSHTGMEYVKRFEDMVGELTQTQLMLFEIGHQFDLTIMEEKKGEFRPTEVMSQDRKAERMEHLSDVPKLLPVEHGKPDEVFEKGLQERSLQKQQDMKSLKKKRLRYLLIDNSGSMRTALQSNRYAMLTRGALATVFAMSLTKRAREEEGMVFFRFFAGSPSMLYSARQKDEFDTVMKGIAHMDWSGGGTDILSVVSAAVNDITEAKDEIAKSEIILISDCEDSFNANSIKKVLGKLPMNVLDISGNAGARRLQYEGSKALKQAGVKYHLVNPGAVDIKAIVELI